MSNQSLTDEIALRRASILDAERELADGELTEPEFADLVAREREAIARCELVLAQPIVPVLRRRRRALLWVALFCLIVAVAGTLVAALGPRQPGASITGGVAGAQVQEINDDLVTAELDQADDTASSIAAALVAYDAALSLDPTNVEALTQSGWLTFTAGSIAHNAAAVRLGVQRLADAVVDAPTDPDPRLYYAIASASTPGDRALAVHEFRVFLSLNPSPTLRATASKWLREYGLEHSR
jgi:hypothetical protein